MSVRSLEGRVEPTGSRLGLSVVRLSISDRTLAVKRGGEEMLTNKLYPFSKGVRWLELANPILLSNISEPVEG